MPSNVQKDFIMDKKPKLTGVYKKENIVGKPELVTEIFVKSTGQRKEKTRRLTTYKNGVIKSELASCGIIGVKPKSKKED